MLGGCKPSTYIKAEKENLLLLDFLLKVLRELLNPLELNIRVSSLNLVGKGIYADL
jgi:hypothetical protein